MKKEGITRSFSFIFKSIDMWKVNDRKKKESLVNADFTYFFPTSYSIIYYKQDLNSKLEAKIFF